MRIIILFLISLFLTPAFALSKDSKKVDPRDGLYAGIDGDMTKALEVYEQIRGLYSSYAYIEYLETLGGGFIYLTNYRVVKDVLESKLGNDLAIMFFEAQKFKFTNDIKGALEKIEGVLAAQPNYAPAILMKHMLYTGEFKMDKWLQMMQEVKDADPSFAEPYFMLADYWIGVQNTEKAGLELQKLAQSDDAVTQIRLGYRYQRLNNKEEAAARYKRALELGNPDGGKLLKELKSR